MQDFLEAIEGGASGEDIASLPIPESYRAGARAAGRADDVGGRGVIGEGPAEVASRR